MQTQVYLFFDGRTEEALDFYRKTLGIEVEMLMRFKDAPGPQDPNCPPPKNPNAVMHSSFKLGDQRVMASDGDSGGKPEFTLIGDAVNVAARVEQLTKTTGDAILLTQQSIDALASRPLGLVDRGAHALKGKSAGTQVFGVDPASQWSM